MYKKQIWLISTYKYPKQYIKDEKTSTWKFWNARKLLNQFSPVTAASKRKQNNVKKEFYI